MAGTGCERRRYCWNIACNVLCASPACCSAGDDEEGFGYLVLCSLVNAAGRSHHGQAMPNRIKRAATTIWEDQWPTLQGKQPDQLLSETLLKARGKSALAVSSASLCVCVHLTIGCEDQLQVRAVPSRSRVLEGQLLQAGDASFPWHPTD